MKIALYIERLVIDAAALGGERAGDVRAAIERELAERLMQPGAIDVLRPIGAIDRLPELALPAARHPRKSLGRSIASAVGDGLGLPPPSATQSARGRAAPGATS